MRVEIDQSGKIEDTSKRTVVGDSLGNYVVMKSLDKRHIQRVYRNAGQPRVFVIQTFSFLVALLLSKTSTHTHEYWIDIEYPGKNDEILHYILYFCKLMRVEISPKHIHFTLVGKGSKAHGVSYTAFKKKRVGKTISSVVMMQYILPQKKDRGNVNI